MCARIYRQSTARPATIEDKRRRRRFGVHQDTCAPESIAIPFPVPRPLRISAVAEVWGFSILEIEDRHERAVVRPRDLYRQAAQIRRPTRGATRAHALLIWALSHGFGSDVEDHQPHPVVSSRHKRHLRTV